MLTILADAATSLAAKSVEAGPPSLIPRSSPPPMTNKPERRE